MEESGNYTYLQKIAPECKLLFDEYEYEFYNFMDGEELLITDSYFIDGYHGAEVAYGIILLNMSKSGSRINDCIDQNALEKLIENSFDERVFFNPTGQ